MKKIITLKDNIILSADLAAKEILNYTPQIYLREPGRTDGKNISPFASSVLISVQEQFFLLGAGHVFEENHIEDLGILIGNRFNILQGLISYVNPFQNDIANKIDVAILKLPLDLVKIIRQKYEFLSYQKIGIDHELIFEEIRYLVVGFPWRKSRPNPVKKTIKPKPLVFISNIAGDEGYKALNLEKHNNIILNYKQKNVIEAKSGHSKLGPNPEGISGCGIWLIDVYPPSPKPNYKLVSIVTDKDKNKKYIQSTRIDIVNEILIKDFKLNLNHSKIVTIEK
jgi:hypothetical protein